MKVILVNGSPHKEGCTYTALSEEMMLSLGAGGEHLPIWAAFLQRGSLPLHLPVGKDQRIEGDEEERQV
jgi:hypothetical protein